MSGNPCLRKGEKIPGGGDTTTANKVRIGKADKYAQDMISVIAEFQETGSTSLREIADDLNNAGYKTAKGGQWHATSVSRILKRF